MIDLRAPEVPAVDLYKTGLNNSHLWVGKEFTGS